MVRHWRADRQQTERIEQLETELAALRESLPDRVALPAEPLPQDRPVAKVSAVVGERKRSVDRTEKPPEVRETAQRTTGKFAEPSRFDLNSIDSLTLIRIPGIASRTASVILTYRRRLGGFVHPRQLAECLTWESARERMDEWCAQWFEADTTRLLPLAINRLSFRQLLRHPYLEYRQVQELVRFRDRYKRIPSIRVLELMESFEASDIERLRPYLNFE